MAEFELSADQFYTIDATTGLANRRGFEILASHSLAICQRQGLRATLLHIDLEGFGAINAERGTAFADELLRIVGEEVTSVFRESDSLGRVGPDEFAALLTDTAPEQVEVVLSRLHAALREAGQELDSEFSLNFGYASVEYAPGRHAALPMLLAEAESSLHESVLA